MKNQIENMTLTTKEKLIMLFYSAIALISFCTMFKTCGYDYSEKKPQHTIEANKVQVESKRIEKAYQIELKQLKAHSDSLELKLKSVNKKLIIADYNAKTSSEQLTEMINRYNADTSLEKNSIAFDSLADYSFSLIRDVSVRDSLCDNEINLLNELLFVKDSTIEVSQDAYEDLKMNFNDLSQQHEILITDYGKLNRKNKRKQFATRFFAGTTTILSGICLTMFIKR